MAVNINIPSQVSQTITDGVTDKAPSENAVFDALALKADASDLNGYVPYTGATSDVDLGTYNITADHISLNVSPSGAGFGVGATQWNNTIGSSETLLKGGSVTLKNGVDLVARVVNKVSPNTTLTKAAYQAVKVSGAQGGRLAIGLAQGNTDLNSADTIGLVTETIATNQEGFIITVGQLSDINTTGSLQGETWADGDVLYLSPTTAGRLTNIKPTGATGHIVVIGYVEYAHATQGAIYVKIMNGWELDELHNVYITNPTGGAGLEYQASTQLWVDAGIQYTIELVAALTVDFYAPYQMVITSVSNVLNSPTITIQDDNVAYTLGNTIAVGSKVTVTASVASVVNLNITK
jgi:nitrogen fixation protein